MRDRIQEYLDGKFNESCPEIGLSPETIEVYAGEGSVFSGDFFLESISNEKIKGQIFCNDLRVNLPEKEFSGALWTVPYEISVEGLQMGDAVSGEIQIVTNYGEYKLPYTVNVGELPEKEEERSVKNLFHFANMAREEWERAAAFFKKKAFYNLLVNNDRQYRNLYRGLAVNGLDEQAMDEFLVAVHKKDRVSLWLEKSEEHLYPVHLDEDHNISITKESWGYIEADVEWNKNGFLQIQKKKLTRDDFVGNLCQIPYKIRKEKLHKGMNQEKVLIKTPYQELCFEITAEYGETDPLWEIQRTLLKYRIQFWELYLSFRKKDITSGFWVEQSLGVIDRVLRLDRDNQEWRLLKAQMLFLGKRETEGKILLDSFEKGKYLKDTSPVLYGYYLYLSACYKKEKKLAKKVTEELWRQYRANEEPFPILWMLLYLDEEMEENFGKKWELLREQHKKGNASPMLYAEALQLLKKEEGLFRRLGSFEVHLMLFAIKRDMFKQKWLERILSLSVKNNQFHPLLFKLYKSCYQMAPGKEWLAVIIGLLVRSGEIREEYLEWYELAVQQNMNIAGIFEKFMEHIQFRGRKKLPRSVVEYYARSADSLREDQKGMLFSLVMDFGLPGRTKSGDTAARYEKMIHYFVREQLLKGKMSVSLARLYNEYLDWDILSEEEALDKCGELLFKKQIKSDYKNICKVLVVHEKLTEIEEYPWQDNQAIVPLYSEEDVLILVDDCGRRYTLEKDYRAKQMLNYRKFESFFEDGIRQPLGLMLHTEVAGQKYRNISPENQYQLELLVKDSRLTKGFRMELFLALAEYYKNSFQSEKLRNILEEAPVEEYPAFERCVMLEMMLGEGMYHKAYPVICRYGFEYGDFRLLVGLLNDRIEEVDFEEELQLVRLCFQVVKKGKYTEKMLKYLALYYNGFLASLKEVWKEVHNFNLDDSILAERILARIVFMGGTAIDCKEIFASYTGKNAYDDLAKAYLCLEAYDYFVREKKTAESVLKELEPLLLKGCKLPKVCSLAFLKRCTNEKELGERTRELAVKLTRTFLRMGEVYPFFKELEQLLGVEFGLEHQTVIEYRTRPGSRVWLHYYLETNGTGEERYVTEQLVQEFEGIYTKSITLFFGEKIHYYITEGTMNNRRLKENHVLCGESIKAPFRERRIQMINEMLVKEKQDDMENLFQTMDRYVSMDYLTERLFKHL